MGYSMARFIVDPQGNVREDRPAEATLPSLDSLRSFFETCHTCGGKTSYRFTLNPAASTETFEFWCRGGALLLAGAFLGVWLFVPFAILVVVCSPYYLYCQVCDRCEAGLSRRREAVCGDVRTGSNSSQAVRPLTCRVHLQNAGRVVLSWGPMTVVIACCAGST
jgi:hypothetical protein